MLAILANLYAYSSQRIKDTVPTSDSCILSVYLFENGIMSTALSQFLIYYSTPLLSLLQTTVSYLILYSLIIYTTSIYYL